MNRTAYRTGNTFRQFLSQKCRLRLVQGILCLLVSLGSKLKLLPRGSNFLTERLSAKQERSLLRKLCPLQQQLT